MLCVSWHCFLGNGVVVRVHNVRWCCHGLSVVEKTDG